MNTESRRQMSADVVLARRAAVYAALGEPARLAMIDDLAVSDRSPMELGQRFGLASNLLAHHLDVLEDVGLIVRFVSAGDRRRRYVRLVRGALREFPVVCPQKPVGEMLFLCSHNSARSQLAAALWSARSGLAARSAGTHPAGRVHRGAVAAARRAGIDFAGAVPRLIGDISADTQVVTVCDRAHEELSPSNNWWHWSIPDPVEADTAEAFDAAFADIDARITSIIETTPHTKRTKP